jgi:membrane associated rhomboid family serine protease
VLLIPIGAEEDGSRRTPFITIALIAANVLWYVVLNFSPGGTSWKADVDAARTDLETYWSQHPSLTPPASLVRLLSADEMDELLADVKAAAVDRRPETAWLEEIERRELDLRARRLEEALANRPSEKYGFVPARPSVGGALGSLFTHGGLVHLGGNMLFLWATGPFLESVLGAGAFLVFYLAGGIAALLTHWLASGASPVPLVGASGAIAAVMGGLLVSNAGARIRFFFLPIIWAPRFRFVFGVPAFVVLPLWFLEQVASARLEPEAPVAWWAHIGGFAFGMAVAGALRVRRSRAARPVPRSRVPAPAAVRPVQTGRSRLRIAVVSTGAPGGLVVTRGAQPLLKRTLERAEPGALSLDEMIEVADGPADLRVELRLLGSAPRVASVLGVLKKGEAKILRVEPRASGLAAELR